MRVAHVIWSLATGGLETMLVDIINEQVKSEEVSLFVVNSIFDKDVLNDISKRVRVVFCGRKPKSKSVYPFLKLNYYLWRYHIEIVHCHNNKIGALIRVPVIKVRTIHDLQSKSNDYIYYKRIFCISNGVKRHIALQGNPNGVIIYNGIHVEEIKSTPSRPKKDEKKFICVGRLAPEKGQSLIIEAFHIMINKRGYSGISLDLIGDGPSRKDLEDLVKKYQLNKYVHFLGAKPRRYFYPLLCEYDLFILASLSEGFGLALAEAISAKISVITCDLEGPMEVIDGGHLGRSFKTGDVESLMNAIEDFLLRGDNETQIDDAYNYIKDNFDIKKTADLYLCNYVELLGESKKNK